MLYTRLLEMPSRAEYSFLALSASLVPPTVRIARAKELLIHTDNTNYGIAKAIGYSSEYHFSRAFSKIVGVSPSAYKKLYMDIQ